ncbi:hypothetical protein [Salinicoccus halodurans]|uniref:Phosphate starvation-inducible protein PhoH n=1 Tax=Salinicoccus halodurans TaxID=407035 RepID=A0A0F7HHW5_9STAP|nr:hypothetical protein [Salinicoccus halodurans]AKG72841.1 hypothetical protein AAT16_00560 [Salinicoccus halodurans]SFK74998.1 hypothetical protein SAMN05216235_1478 [Salinicoccus halodurans]
MSIALIVNGTPYQNRFLEEPDFHYLYDEVIHLREMDYYDMSKFETVLLSCRLDIKLLKRYQTRFLKVLEAGKRIIIFGEFPEHAFPSVDWEDSEVDFSWWVRPDGDLPLNQEHADHPLYRYITVPDMKWHYHGTFTPPHGAKSLLDTPEGRSIIYIDNVSFNGELIVTSLDPMFHIGLGFINQSKPFLHGLAKWLREEEQQ